MFKRKIELTGLITAALVLSFAAIALAGETKIPAQDKTICKKGYYTVKQGDTLYEIALNHHIRLNDLMEINNLSRTTIFPGEQILIPENDFIYTSRGKFPREDFILLAKIIHAEARGESLNGKIAVGAVILNRLASPYFPHTIREIIWQKNNKVYQFSPVADGSINLEPDEQSIHAAELALAGEDPTNGALFFYNPTISTDKWIKTLPVVSRIGNHVFATKA